MPKSLAGLKVAIIHDWLINSGGAERQLAAVAELFPQSPIYTSVWNRQGSLAVLRHRDVRVGWPGRLPLIGRFHRLAVLPRYLYWRRLRLDDYDLIISSSGSEAKCIKTKPHQLHINICYTPPHYYWSHYRQHLRSPGLGLANWPARIVLFLFIKPLRALDRWAARQPDQMIAISNVVSERIKRYYGRESAVIFPPVELPPTSKRKTDKRRGYVVLGRHVPYKNLDLAVLACQQTLRSLNIVGQGPDSRRLKRLAKANEGLLTRRLRHKIGQTIHFAGHISEAEKQQLLAQARACIFPGVDDFGMVMVEALAVGTPVVALAEGGALDVIDSGCGVFFRRPTVESLIGGLERFESAELDPKDCRRQAAKFSKKVFQTKFKRYIEKAWKEFDVRQDHN